MLSIPLSLLPGYCPQVPTASNGTRRQDATRRGMVRLRWSIRVGYVLIRCAVTQADLIELLEQSGVTEPLREHDLVRTGEKKSRLNIKTPHKAAPHFQIAKRLVSNVCISYRHLCAMVSIGMISRICIIYR